MSDERKPMTDEELAAIQGRLKNITPPPWFHVLASIVGTKDDPESPDATCVCCTEWGSCGDDPQANAAFIAHAPDDIAHLLAEVERLREEVKRRDAFIAQQKSFSQSLEEDLNFQAAVEDALIKKLFDHRICHRKWQCEQVDKPEWEFNDDEDEQRCHSCWSQWACDEAKAMFKEGGDHDE